MVQRVKDIHRDALRGAQRFVLEDFKRNVDRDFGADVEETDTFLKQRGGERRVFINSFDPRFLRFPLTFRTVAKGEGEILQALEYTFRTVRNNAPFVTGRYRRSVEVTVSFRGRAHTVSSIAAVRTYVESGQADQGFRAGVVGTAPYSSYLEARSVFRGQGGFFWMAIKDLRKRGFEVSQRFGWIQSAALGISYRDMNQSSVQLPMIEIGQPGAFAENDGSRPGRRARAARAKARRAASRG